MARLHPQIPRAAWLFEDDEGGFERRYLRLVRFFGQQGLLREDCRDLAQETLFRAYRGRLGLHDAGGPDVSAEQLRLEFFQAMYRLFERIAERQEQLAEKSPDSGVEDQIEHLYDEIIALTDREDLTSSERDNQIKRAYARLHELQTAEAAIFRERFEASLDMPIDAGARILARTRTLRGELEDLTASDPATALPDDPKASPEAG